MSIRDLALRRLEADGEAFFAAAERDPTADVQACPGWNVDKLVGHMGRIHTWATQVVRSRTTERISSRLFPEGPDEPVQRLRWGRERHAELVDALNDLGEDDPVWIWSPEGIGHGRFWHRRQAHELALHRWDAQRATGDPEPLDGELAADGIEELFAVFLTPTGGSTRQVSTDGATLHLHCTDRDGEWLVRFTPEGPSLTAEHAKADAAVRAPASDLFLLLWNRISREGLEVFGDASLLDRWAEHVHV
jgi:uncharacterized protein (TIGR03083 family)